MAKKPTTKKTRESKPNRFKNFFLGLKGELKRVVWPDKKRLFQSSAGVLFIILFSALLVWVFDTVIRSVLTASGFYNPKATPAISQPADPKEDKQDIEITEPKDVETEADGE